nr:hypothetical protein [Tanacetum cinerariifolium]
GAGVVVVSVLSSGWKKKGRQQQGVVVVPVLAGDGRWQRGPLWWRRLPWLAAAMVVRVVVHVGGSDRSDN